MRQDQTISGIIGHLHELKSSYQRNMLVAMLVTAVLAGFATWLVSLHATSQKLHGIVEVTTPAKERSRTPTGLAANGYEIRPSNYRNQAGFGGLNGYFVSRDGFITGTHQVSLVSPLGPDFPQSFGHDNHPFSYTPLSDEDSYGLPRPETFFEIVPSYSWGTSIGLSYSDVTGPSGQDSPPLIRLAEVRYPRKGLFVSGTVKVVFTITAKGNIENYELIDEVPQGHEFAIALKEAINESVFFPGTIAGKSSSTRIMLTYEFCWDCSKPTGVQISEGVIVARKPF